MKRLLALYRRARAWMAIRSVERRLHDVIELQDTDIRDFSVRLALAIQREDLSRVLAEKRAAYVAEYMAPGERMTFDTA